jgi:hypothetical protein
MAKGRKPKRPAGKVSEPPPPPNYEDETPKFCLHYVQDGYDVQALSREQQAALAKTLQKLAALTWRQIGLAPRHGSGFEWIPADQIRPPVPARFQDVARFMIFRYSGLHPMGGYRINDVYHILWIERDFGELYQH